MKQSSNEEKSYAEFFKEEIYRGFVQFLLNKYGASSIITMLQDEPIMTKKGVNFLLRKSFNEYLKKHPQVEKRFVENRMKFLGMRNICDQPLRFPIDTSDDMLMVKQELRPLTFIPVDNNIPRAKSKAKKSAEKMRGQLIKGDWHEKPYIYSKRLTVHFKRGFAKAIGKSTITFRVDSRSEAINILLNKYKNKVAFANIQNTESFEFVKRLDKKRKPSDAEKRDAKLHRKV